MTESDNIAHRLTEMARLRPDAPAVVVPHRRGQQVDFRTLDEGTDDVARGLQQQGITGNTRVALMVPPGIDFVVLTFALLKAGAVPILIDPGMGVHGLGRCLEDAQPEAFIGSTKAVIAKRLFGWGRTTAKITIRVGRHWWGHNAVERLARRGRRHRDRELPRRAAQDLAAILFTSGSTGPAKGAVYTHGMFQEQVRVLRNVFAIEPGEIDLCTFPLFALFAPALGMTSIVPDMDPTRPAHADPRKLVHAIREFKVTNIFGSPALIRVLADYGVTNNIKLPTVRRVISAGAPVPADVIARMTQLLNPGVQMWTPYGATEALPIAVIGSDEVLNDTRAVTDRGGGICVGRPVGDVEVRIIPISDAPLTGLPDALPTGEIGEITVRGPVVSAHYWNRPDGDTQHKIIEGDTVWHRVGDVGYMDDQGRLWFCGRKTHRLVVGDETLFTIPVEAIFNTHPAVLRSALVNAGGRPCLCVELKPGVKENNDLMDQLRELRERFPPAMLIDDFLVYPKPFPVDIRHNAKIDRDQLGQWAAGRLR
jgi:acyl-CoA synthetase (AMP-forming)/AMP-acid ligase II